MGTKQAMEFHFQQALVRANWTNHPLVAWEIYIHVVYTHLPSGPSLDTSTELELFFTSTYQVRFDRYGAAKASVAPSRVLGVPVELTVHGGCVC